MKKFLSVMLAVLLLLPTLASFASADGADGDLAYDEVPFEPEEVICDATETNVASEAYFSATGADNWWAISYKHLVDGDPNTGTHTPRGINYSIWMNFSKEYFFSQIDLVCNTNGGATFPYTGTVLDDRYIGNKQLRVRVYNNNEDLVWDSDIVDTSELITLSVTPYVEGAIIEICFYNGNYGGSEYMYEVSAYAQEGDHLLEETAVENPTCSHSGYRDLVCLCGKNIRQIIPATGFHRWSYGEAEVTQEPTATENGVLTVPCRMCDSVKLCDAAAIGHNWDLGTVVQPACDSEGYTLYSCTDEGCALTYKANYTNALAHIWDDGIITKFPSVTEEGVITYTCSVCGGESNGRIRKHKYSDNVVDFTSESIVSTEVVINTESTLYYPDTYTGINPEALFDGDMLTYWYGPPETYVVFTLDKEYAFTSGFFYMSANWCRSTVEFLDADDNVVAIFETGNVEYYRPDDPKQLDMLSVLLDGVVARKIKVTSVSPKWSNGQSSTMHELELKVHACQFSEVDYIMDDSYVAPQCGVDGSCNARCQTCGAIERVVIEATPDVGHDFDYDRTTVDVLPTCAEAGSASIWCNRCNTTVSGVTIPATGNHEYNADVVVVAPKGSLSGVGNKVCSDCGRVAYVYEILPEKCEECVTSEHVIFESYVEPIKVEERCDICGYVVSSYKIPALFTCLGYSASTYGNYGITVGFTVNKEAIEEYEGVSGQSLRYGVFAVTNSSNSDKSLFDENGDVTKGFISSELTSLNVKLLEMKVLNIPERNADKPMAMGMYVSSSDGETTECTYIQDTAIGQWAGNYSFVTYNRIAQNG